MIYIEYAAWLGCEEKNLGILDETHIYTKEESEFARSVLNEYEAYTN